MLRLKLALFIFGLIVLPLAVHGQTSTLPVVGQHVTASPESVGISTERLDLMDARLQQFVDENKMAGVITFVARKGEIVHFNPYGLRDQEANAPMSHDTIFRIYSMTKPITVVAALMLLEEGHFLLNEPVARYIPEFEDLMVYDASAEDGSKRGQQKRPMSIRDLMRHTSGLSYGLFSQTAVDTMYRQMNVLDMSGTLKDMVTKLGQIPLLHQPGETWHYGLSTDVLGYLVEVVSGQPLDVFFKERIFEPLGMVDTGFYVPAEKIDRFAANYRLTQAGNLLVQDAPATSNYVKKPTFFSGGGGLVSTPADYFRFTQMLLNGGELNGSRLLGRKTVELMTSNHLDGEYRPGYGFGLGVRVCTDVARTQTPGSVGEHGWAGLANTYYFVDPKEALIGVLWAQFFGALPIRDLFKSGVYQAVVD